MPILMPTERNDPLIAHWSSAGLLLVALYLKSPYKTQLLTQTHAINDLDEKRTRSVLHLFLSLDVVIDVRHNTHLPHTLPVRPDLSSLRGSGLTWSVILWTVFPSSSQVRRRFALTYPQAIAVVIVASPHTKAAPARGVAGAAMVRVRGIRVSCRVLPIGAAHLELYGIVVDW